MRKAQHPSGKLQDAALLYYKLLNFEFLLWLHYCVGQELEISNGYICKVTPLFAKPEIYGNPAAQKSH